ncbi:MAG: hypothetical protein JST00_17730 [Deltaproteobacteria bacterium]|nr:hypothetical protein [Deltaproteobacteria bacterium]
MFSTVVRYNKEPVEFAMSAAFERQFRLFGIVRRGLKFDTRFAPPASGASNAMIVFLLLDGNLRWSDGRELEGPSLFLLPETEYEGANGVRTRHFRAWGEPFCSVDLRLDRRHCAEERSHVPIDALVRAGRSYLHASQSAKGQTLIADLAAAYLRELRAHGVVTTDLAATMTRDEGLRGVVWEALRPVIAGFGGSKQEELTSKIGWGRHRLQRTLTRMAMEHGAAWMGGWRDIAFRYRVRVAALLLSNPSLTVSDVASAVGYTSVEALAHAFEASGLPPATEVREQLLQAAP